MSRFGEKKLNANNKAPRFARRLNKMNVNDPVKWRIRKRENKTTPEALPICEQTTIQEVKLWWKRLIQYVKMTQDIGLNTMTTDKKTISDYREEMEMKIKDIFIFHFSALGEATLTGKTKTVRDSDPKKDFKPAVFTVQTPFSTGKK